MNLEKILTTIFLVFGIFSGVISNYFTNLTLSVSIPLLIYFVIQILLMRFYNIKRLKKLIYTNFMTFVLIWLVTWILLFNLNIS